MNSDQSFLILQYLI